MKIITKLKSIYDRDKACLPCRPFILHNALLLYGSRHVVIITLAKLHYFLKYVTENIVLCILFSMDGGWLAGASAASSIVS